ncbi:MAG: ATP-NAD kinase family protein [archaeon]
MCQLCGRVGLKGTDGEEAPHEALRRGSEPVAPIRIKETLRILADYSNEIVVLTCSGEMGELEAIELGLYPVVVLKVPDDSSAADTRRAASRLAELRVDLILFAGGDGTARDIFDAIDGDLPVLGVPAGVKMHSGVFAINPQEAGRIAIRFLRGEVSTTQAEVMDVDEEAYRLGRLSAKLYGYMMIPHEAGLVQGIKTGSLQTTEEIEQQKSVAKHVVEEMQDDTLYILGPGTTVKAITDYLRLEKTLLGVDVLRNRKMLGIDANERQILELLDGNSKIIVTPIGGQAYVFGRGNQQISPAVIRTVGKENIIIVATKNKIFNLPVRRLLVDTGDSLLDSTLRGYVRVVTDYREETLLRIE